MSLKDATLKTLNLDVIIRPFQKMSSAKTPSKVSILELRSLLASIADNGKATCFRFRLMGEMWRPHFMRVIKITEKGVLLNDELHNRLIFVSELKMIIQFELDSSFYAFEPHFHYEVRPDQDLWK